MNYGAILRTFTKTPTLIYSDKKVDLKSIKNNVPGSAKALTSGKKIQSGKDIAGYVKNVENIASAVNDLKSMAFRVDIVRSREITMQQDVTQHPVETGFVISDHIVNKPIGLTMTVGVSSLPITWSMINGKGKSKFNDGFAALETIRNNKETVTIVTPDKVYKDFVLTNIRWSKTDESLSVIWVDLNFIHIQKVDTMMVKIPENLVDPIVEESAGQTKADGGAGNTEGVGTGDFGGGGYKEYETPEGQEQSTLHGLFFGK